MAQAQGQQHPIGVYLKIWALLFVFSAFSYLVDYLGFEGYLRWFLILLFMMLKAGLKTHTRSTKCQYKPMISTLS